MPEYISREALLAAYDAEHVGPPGRARELIASAPAADVRPVVRCRNCLHFYDGPDEKCCMYHLGIMTDENRTCQHALRRISDD